MVEKDIVKMITDICVKHGSKSLMKPLNIEPKNSIGIFNWLMGAFSYQGVSDEIADSFIEEHGNITHRQITIKLIKLGRKCSKLSNFESFTNCGYKKNKESCNNLRMYNSCPLPTHNLRKGALNQLAYSLYFFKRDVCQDDFIGFIDKCFKKYETEKEGPNKSKQMQKDITERFCLIYGVNNKLSNMALADMLIGWDKKKSDWMRVGCSMIAIDSLVHNFMHRTGILKYYKAEHRYGECYDENSCFDIIYNLSNKINCNKIFSSYPEFFPRHIQFSIWRFCSKGNSNICNGNNINKIQYFCKNNCAFDNICSKIPLSS